MAEREFIVRLEESDDATRRVTIEVPLDLRYFDGHFEGRPMLPGVAQVAALADRHARRLVAGLGPVLRLQRVKFTAVVTPGERLELTLTEERRSEEVIVRWRLERPDMPDEARLASSGTLVYLAA